jgi:acetyl/propionyl-CoA carboxylase alpha subunit
VEFIYDAATEAFYFLEMNTRLQVEHPITEMVTGIDIARWQLRIAGGAALTLVQDDIRCNGWAMEARLAAEDPATNFRPETGKITDIVFPAGDNLRVDSGITKGVTVGHHYDSMLAKVIAFGCNRATALRRLRRALDETRLDGVGCNLGFLCSLLDLPPFLSGTHHTGLVADTWPEGWERPPLTDDDRVSAVVSTLQATQHENSADASPWQSFGAWRVTTPLGRSGTATRYLRDDSGTLTAAAVNDDGGRITVHLKDTDAQIIDAANWADDILTLARAGQIEMHVARVHNGSVTLWRDGNARQIEVLTPEEALLGAPSDTASDTAAITAPMPGLIVDVRVSPGDTVAAGDTILVLEAMKLLQNLKSPRNANVLEVRHQPGNTVDGGAILVTFETKEP